jgi:hypothetical protein
VDAAGSRPAHGIAGRGESFERTEEVAPDGDGMDNRKARSREQNREEKSRKNNASSDSVSAHWRSPPVIQFLFYRQRTDRQDVITMNTENVKRFRE